MNFKDECDWKFVDEQLNYAGLLCFRNLLQKLIDGYRDDELLNCIFKSGAFGTGVNSLNLAIVKDGEKMCIRDRENEKCHLFHLQLIKNFH